MHLVEHLPKAVGVPDAVPPVEDKGSDQPADEPLQERRAQRAQVDKRRLVCEHAVPDLVADQGEADLTEVDSQRPTIPAGCVRECPAGPNPFEDKEGRGRDDGEDGGRREGHAVLNAMIAGLVRTRRTCVHPALGRRQTDASKLPAVLGA